MANMSIELNPFRRLIKIRDPVRWTTNNAINMSRNVIWVSILIIEKGVPLVITPDQLVM